MKRFPRPVYPVFAGWAILLAAAATIWVTCGPWIFLLAAGVVVPALVAWGWWQRQKRLQFIERHIAVIKQAKRTQVLRRKAPGLLVHTRGLHDRVNLADGEMVGWCRIITDNWDAAEATALREIAQKEWSAPEQVYPHRGERER